MNGRKNAKNPWREDLLRTHQPLVQLVAVLDFIDAYRQYQKQKLPSEAMPDAGYPPEKIGIVVTP